MPPSRKVLHIVSANCEWEVAMRIVGLAAALREKGWPSVVTAPENARLAEYADAFGVEVAHYDLTGKFNPLQWTKLADAIKSLDIGVCHAHDPLAAAVLAKARWFAPVGGVATTRYILGKPTAAECDGGVGAVICLSEISARDFEKYRGAREKTHVAPAGVALPAARRAEEERDAVRQKCRDDFCPAKEKPLFIVNMAPLEESSRQSDLLEGMPDIVSALPQTHLVIMGEGTLKAELERQIRVTALENDVSIIEPDKAFARFLAAADVVVSATRDDAAGIMVQTAMACGRAVVLSSSGCHGELAEHGKTGVLVEGTGPEPYIAAILDLLHNRTRRDHLGRMARALALKRFDMAELAERIADIYKRIQQG